MFWLPFLIQFTGLDLQPNQICCALVSPGHSRQRFPIDAFLINTLAAPIFFVLKNLMRELVDSRTCLAGAPP
jgi:hypothetical protein